MCADYGAKINNEIGCIEIIFSLKHDSIQVFVIYRTYQVMENFYDYPLASGNLGIYIVRSLQNNIKVFSYKAIQSKDVFLPLYKKISSSFPSTSQPPSPVTTKHWQHYGLLQNLKGCSFSRNARSVSCSVCMALKKRKKM